MAKESQSEAYVGSGALFPRRLFVNKKPVIAEIAGDFAVEKEHRVYGPALKLQKTIQSTLSEDSFKFIYGVPNKLSETLFLKIGYKEIGKFNKFVKVLKNEYKEKKYLSDFLRVKIFGYILDYIIKLFSKENWYKGMADFSIETPEHFDQRFDKLWAIALKQFNMIGERTSKFLDWRYKQSPAQKYETFCIVDKKMNIAGYIIYYDKDNMSNIVDMLFIESDKILGTLLVKFILFLRKKGIGSISIYYLGNNSLERKLKEFNFFLRKEEDVKVLIYSRNNSMESELLDKNKWYFLAGDNDA